VRLHAGPRRQWAGIDCERARPAHARRDGAARDEEVDDLEPLLAQQPPPVDHRLEDLGHVAFAAGRADEVGPLDEAHLVVQERADLVEARPGVGDHREVALDDGGRLHGRLLARDPRP
jgi:hypothetical protein